MLYIIYFLVLFLAGAYCWLNIYGQFFLQWYIREDSRFFSTIPLFSFYDVWIWFSTPFNSLGQYRPMTQLYWASTRFFGLFDPKFYHWITFFLLVTTGFFLFLFLFSLFKNSLLALSFSFCYCMFITHAKPLFWIAAWQNTSAAFFCMLSLWLRLQAWRKHERLGRASELYRYFSVAAFFLALASNNNAMPWAIVLLFLDGIFFSKYCWKKSWDIVLLTSFLFFYLYILNRPLLHTGLRDVHELVPKIDTLVAMVRYLCSFFSFSGGEGLWTKINKSEILLLVLFLLSSLHLFVLSKKQKYFLLPLLMTVFGILLNSLYFNKWAIEYTSIMGLGVAAVFCASLSAVLSNINLRGEIAKSVSFVMALGVLFLVHNLQKSSVEDWLPKYLVEGNELHKFTVQLQALDKKIPAGMAIYIREIPALHTSNMWRSHHWLAEGVEEFLPQHFVLLNSNTLETSQSTLMHDYFGSHWSWMGGRPKAVTVSYDFDGFHIFSAAGNK